MNNKQSDNILIKNLQLAFENLKSYLVNKIDTGVASIQDTKDTVSNHTSSITDINSSLSEIASEQTTQNTNIANKVDKVTGKGLSTNDYDNTEKAQVATNKSDLTTLKSQVSSLSSGAPVPVSLAANMTNTAKVYVYTGTEAGYTNGNWYYYNGSAWVSGGVYQSTGIANQGVSFSKMSIDAFNSIKKVSEYKQMTYDIVTGGYQINDGALRSDFTGWKALKVSCSPGDALRATASVTGTIVALAVFYDINNNLLSYLIKGGTGIVQYTDYEFFVPDGAYYVAITSNTSNPKLEKLQSISINNSIKDIESNLSNFEDVTSVTIKNGFYQGSSFTTDSGGGFKTYEVACNEGEIYMVTGAVENQYTYFIEFFKDTTYLSYLIKGSTRQRIENYIFTIPKGINKFALLNNTTLGNYSIKKQTSTLLNISVKMDKIDNELNSLKSYWNGKKIVWFGTSIPAGGLSGLGNTNSYPMRIGNILGATVYNEAIGSSMARRGIAALKTANDPYGWIGQAWDAVTRSLGMTIAEKNELINNWDTWKTKLGGTGIPNSLTDSDKAFILSCSYENKLKKYLTGGSVGKVDLYVFDHGHNDMYWGDLNDIKTIPSDVYDRGYFIGAINFLINVILTDNPHARICFIGNYENQEYGKDYLAKAQQVLADYWSLPLMPLWEKLGWSQKTITTTGYWGSDGIWVESGGTSQTLTMKQIWLKDNTHPHSDASGKALDLVSNTLAPWLETIR